MYLHKTPFLLKYLYPSLLWHKSRSEKKIYVTFDDGPIPEVTDFVLETLKNYNAFATFFCVGDNIRKHPEIFLSLLKNNHSTGNHTFNHLNGFKSSFDDYLQNIEKCRTIIETYPGAKTELYRPPYGRIRNNHIDALKTDYQIIMWDVLSGDFDKRLSKEKCLSSSIKHTSKGSIIVFHDSIKTFDTLRYVLPRYLQHFKELDFTFEAL